MREVSGVVVEVLVFGLVIVGGGVLLWWLHPLAAIVPALSS